MSVWDRCFIPHRRKESIAGLLEVIDFVKLEIMDMAVMGIVIGQMEILLCS
jgi:hypothetical protein